MTQDLNPMADLLTLMGLFYKIDKPADKQSAYEQLTAILEPLAGSGPDIPRHMGVMAQHMAQFTLSHRSDLPQEEQLQLAFDYFNKAADYHERVLTQAADDIRHKSCAAQSREALAWLYEQGVIRDGEKNLQKAYALRLKAAHAGNPDAQMNLGIMCYRGEGRAESKWRALYWMDAVVNKEQATSAMQLEAQILFNQITHELGGPLKQPVRPTRGPQRDPFEPTPYD